MCKLTLTTPIALVLFLPFVTVRAERVGHQFAGSLTGGTSGTYTLFGITVPRNSPVSGTFSYDTTTPGVDTASGVRTYHQTISGGYTLDINNGAIKLAASDYLITVANDNGSPASDIFSVDYNYDIGAVPPIMPEKIVVNGTSYGGTRAFIKVHFSWDPATFVDPDEPKLTGDRPETPDGTVTSFVGSSPSPIPRIFSVTPASISAIPPLAGDYNRDGKLDANDYTEWRKAFGETQQPLYADGNNNGEVDAADYIIWRKSSTPASGFALIPEPAGITTIVTGLILFVWRPMPWQHDVRQR